MSPAGNTVGRTVLYKGLSFHDCRSSTFVGEVTTGGPCKSSNVGR